MGILNYDYREIRKLELVANEILALENHFGNLSDLELANKTYEFKNRLKQGESLDSILVEAFAVCRETTFRILGKKHYKVQLMGGIVIHQGRVVEMKTGEGKTLTELCPAYLNALTDRGVHIITVNDYLSKRDKEEMEGVFEFLNLSVGLVIGKTEDRRDQYRKDITYTTNTEVGFDFLRDNLVFEVRDKVLRALNYAIVDEIDSVFIDEARTPLIISAKGEDSTEIYNHINNIISRLEKNDYKIDYESNVIFLTEKGIYKIEKILNLNTISNSEDSEINHIIVQSLTANFMLKKDKDYIVKDGQVILIDQNTGRISEGRRLSNGLHQCIEAKEDVEIKSESKTLGTITYQNLFNIYKKVSGMSGTVKTEEIEFRNIYDLDVIEIPTNRRIRRIDYKDLIYKNKEDKFNAIVEDIIETNRIGRPVLVGTLSIIDSEIISKKLDEIAIKHKLLNAKNDFDEANIVQKAGEKNAITIATSMAGRGTDIKISDDINELGGLRVIGAERAESRRVDNQLVGRSGRQGNKGSSQFYISLQDDLVIKNSKVDLIPKYDGKCSGKLRKEVNHLQRVVSSKQYELRKDNTKYNEIINVHRRIIYRERDLILFGKNISLTVTNMILDVNTIIIKDLFEKFFVKNRAKASKFKRDEFFECLLSEMKVKYNFSFYEVADYITQMDNLSQIIEYCTDQLISYFNRLSELKIIDFKIHVRKNFLIIIDENWVKHLKAMELLKQRVKNQSYNQKDPIVIYNKEGFNLYNELVESIKLDFVEALFKIIIPSLVAEYENSDS